MHDRYGCVLIHTGSIQATNISAIAVLMSQPENVQAFRKAVGDYSTGEGREIMQFMLPFAKTRRSEHCKTIEAYCKEFVYNEHVMVGNLYWIAASLLFKVNFVVISNSSPMADGK